MKDALWFLFSWGLPTFSAVYTLDRTDRLLPVFAAFIGATAVVLFSAAIFYK